MSISHEVAAQKEHPSAKEFQPVKKSFSHLLYGWTFMVEEAGTNFPRFAWVTSDGEVSTDLLRVRGDAARNLKIYVKSCPPAVAPITVRNTGSATAIGPGSVASTGNIGHVSTGSREDKFRKESS